MDPELLGRVGGLGRGTLLGFSLVVTEGEIIGIDETRKTFRFWLATIGSIALGLPVYFGLVYFTEPVLFRINSLLSFVTFLVAPFLIFVFLLLRVHYYSDGELRRPESSQSRLLGMMFPGSNLADPTGSTREDTSLFGRKPEVGSVSGALAERNLTMFCVSFRSFVHWSRK